jgi:Zn-dependent peptidase ImmA (M78 family)
MGIMLNFMPLGNEPDAIKGFYVEALRVRAITVNSDLPLVIQKIIVAHELGHAELHRHCGVHAFHDVGLFDESSQYEKEANLFAAEFMLKDEAVLDTLNADNTFFTAAAQLNVPMELLDFKFRVMKWKGFKLVEPPIQAPSNFLRNIEMPDCEPYFC